MGRGAQGSHVTALQRSLKTCCKRSIDVDGQFGPGTETALEYAQRESKIKDDGRYGPETRSMIKCPVYKNGPYAGYCSKI